MNDRNIEALRMQRRTRFQSILEWEQKRSSDSGKYKVILNTLISRIMQKATNSRDANRAIIKFLHEKSQGFKQYSEILLSELTYLPDPPSEAVLPQSEPQTPSRDLDLNINEKFQVKESSLRSGLSSVSNYQSSLSKRFVEASIYIQ
jgi:hypothetical protein